jgi:Domain of unknown function (DUF4345)
VWHERSWRDPGEQLGQMDVTILRSVLVCLSAAYFALIAVVALRRPGGLLKPLGIEAATPAGANEIRAVYGGFPAAMATTLLLSLGVPVLQTAAPLAVAIAMAGMAAGRVVSVAVDRRCDRLPAIYFAIEIVVASALVAVAVLVRAG